MRPWYMRQKPVESVVPKPVHTDNIEILIENNLLKFRDAQDFSYKESPSVELMFLAKTNGIRPITSTNGNRNMFCIPKSDIHQFVTLLEKQFPEFKTTVVQKIEDHKAHLSEALTVPEW